MLLLLLNACTTKCVCSYPEPDPEAETLDMPQGESSEEISFETETILEPPEVQQVSFSEEPEESKYPRLQELSSSSNKEADDNRDRTGERVFLKFE